MPVVLLDRDGVVNANRSDYVKSVGEVRFLPGALDALGRLKAAGWQVVLISNQACVGKEIITEAELREIDRFIRTRVAEAGGEIAESYYCVHRPDDGCSCRKPEPGLVTKASREMGFSPEDAVFVGDAAADIEAGRSAGCRTVLVLSGRTTRRQGDSLAPAPDYTAEDLAGAVDWMIETEG